MRSSQVDHEVAVIGAGFSGIGTAVNLDKAGIHDYLIIDEADGFGGTWHWNTYPGIAVDIPSFSYQFSFDQRSDWSRIYAPGAELKSYAERCAAEHGLHSKARLGTRVTNATFDESAHAWTLETDAGDSIAVRHLIDATGVLNQPKKPDIEGVDDFEGVTVHTARWDHSLDLAGKRVAVIGTGASAIQLIPAVAPEVANLSVFQRTPIWCMPKPDARIPFPVRSALSRLPGAKRVARLASQIFVELTFPLPAHFNGLFPMSTFFEKRGRAYIRQQVNDPELQKKLTPQYSLGCKRPSFHNEYLSTYNRDNVALITDSISRITPRGVVTEDGTEHEIDVLVLATGFKFFEAGNFPKYPVAGRDGVDLEGWWDENRHQAYEGVSVPGFPNYFTVFGPYGFNGSSYFNLVETQSRFIIRAIDHVRKQGATLVEVTREANDRYFAEMLRKRRHQIFWQDGCAGSNSYYFDKHGDVPLRAAPTLETMWRSARSPMSDYRTEKLPAREPEPALR